MLMTCWIWPLAEFSWQLPLAELAWIGAAMALVAKPANAAPTSGTSAAIDTSLRRSRPVTTHLRLQKRTARDLKSPRRPRFSTFMVRRARPEMDRLGLHADDSRARRLRRRCVEVKGSLDGQRSEERRVGKEC